MSQTINKYRVSYIKNDEITKLEPLLDLSINLNKTNPGNPITIK